jgi:hypothetical protein
MSIDRPEFRKLLTNEIIKQFTKNDFKKINTTKLVSINIRLYDQQQKRSKFANDFKFSYSNNKIIPIADFVVETLKDIAYWDISQVANIAIAKMVGDKKEMEIEVIEL